jgi:pyruvate/2-oxoglutarate/acetoin dehydrogenase E1 component
MISYTNYKEQLVEVMKLCNDKDNSLFIGQQILWKGNPMSTTLDFVSKDKMIEVPVMEETQMGMSLGLAMEGYFVVTFYPRWDFLISATNQLINHIDKYSLMSGEIPHIIIRIGKGSDTPLDPGHQHKGNYIEEFKSMMKTVTVMDCKTIEDIRNNYEFAIKTKGIYLINEYPEKYYE